ncbi:Sensory neuron membrane protein 1 [Pseudolycoriella hygida]|uniref:Sensory neuron membrane protein 1 n=1 Tax=Pseudolycoriella hygida TaxID=35572 RepID=A0A9Q0MQU8_9DIPT|nr:Sensory neuron membrane protein 1 [Pseudolycoriella hygida]
MKYNFNQIEILAKILTEIRRLTNKLQTRVNFKWAIISIIAIVSGALIAFYIQPKLVQIITKYLFVAKPGHYIRKRHETKLLFKYKIYLWNVTNPSEITAGAEKPKLQEVGPYVFSQLRRKVNVEDNQNEDTVSFNFHNVYTFDPKLTAPLTGNETVTLLNAVIVSSVIKILFESPHLLGLLIEAMDIVFENPSSVFATMKAMEFLNDGFRIDCNHSEVAVKSLCANMRRHDALKVVGDNVLRYRWFDKLNKTTDSRYTILRGSKNIQDVGRVIAVNGKSKLNVFKDKDECNVINGTDATYFPPFQQREQTLWGFSDRSCKSFPLRHKKMKRKFFGVKTAHKILNFSDPLQSGTALAANTRIQVNFMLKRFPQYRIFSSFIKDVIYLPLLWYDEDFKLEKTDLAIIVSSKMSQFFGTFTGYMLIIVGVLGLVLTTALISQKYIGERVKVGPVQTETVTSK